MSTDGPIAVLFHRHKAVAKVLRNQLRAWSYQVAELTEPGPPTPPSLGLVEASASEHMRELAQRFPSVPLVAVASLRRPFDIFDALRHGAWAAVILQDIHAIRVAVGVKPPKPGEVDPLLQTLERLAVPMAEHAAPSSSQREEHMAAYLSAIRALTKGVGDRLNNPLTLLKSGFETLRDALVELAEEPSLGERIAELREVGQSWGAALERVLALSQAMRGFAMPSSLALGNLDVTRVVRELAPDCTLTSPPEARVFANERAVREALAALLDNAVESYAEAAPVRSVAVTVTVGTAKVSVAIADHGCGMSEEVRARAFEPFFSHGKGPAALGMGLTVARDRVIAMRGEIDLRSELGAGTVVTIELPAAH